jgi:heme iron utilization protein
VSVLDLAGHQLYMSINLIREIIDSQYFAVLSSVEKGQPYTNLVAFAVTEDLKSLIFVTSRNTQKYKNIIQNERVAFLIDNRTNQPSDINRAIAITVIGSAQEENAIQSCFHSVFLNKHPHLSQFVNQPDSALMVVAVSEYLVAGFTKTERVVISSRP